MEHTIAIRASSVGRSIDRPRGDNSAERSVGRTGDGTRSARLAHYHQFRQEAEQANGGGRSPGVTNVMTLLWEYKFTVALSSVILSGAVSWLIRLV